MSRASKSQFRPRDTVIPPTYYPASREQGREAALKEEEQLYLLDIARADHVPADERHAASNRYHQNGAAEKVLGAVYTPPRVAAALTRWAVRSASDKVLDPSSGEGVFMSAARTRLADLGARKPQCVGVDVHPQTAAATGAVCEDFFSWAPSAPKFDVVVGNPPFIRSHLFPETSRRLAFGQMVRMGLKPSRLMSTWAPFLAVCCGVLAPTGRLAMVIPEELLHVGYARELREFVRRRFRRVIVCLPSHDIFQEVQQAVVLLFCDNDHAAEAGLFSIEFSAVEQGDFADLRSAESWPWNPKWTHLFLTAHERGLVDQSWPRLDWHPFRAYGRVEVGVVTGDNDFFVLDEDQAAAFGEKHLMPIVGGAKDLRGIKFGVEDFRRVLSEKRPAFLLRLDAPADQLPKPIRAYLELGERRKINQRYKCRIREPWYAVPSAWESDALLLRQSGEMPRLVHLSKKCTATDTVHRVTWHRPSLGKRHSVSFMNTWTLLACELMGRSYGGGVLELMPSEANRLPLPEPHAALDDIFDVVDERVRARNFYDAVGLVDKVVMPGWMSASGRASAENILAKLIKRRKTRYHANH